MNFKTLTSILICTCGLSACGGGTGGDGTGGDGAGGDGTGGDGGSPPEAALVIKADFIESVSGDFVGEKFVPSSVTTTSGDVLNLATLSIDPAIYSENGEEFSEYFLVTTAADGSSFSVVGFNADFPFGFYASAATAAPTSGFVTYSGQYVGELIRIVREGTVTGSVAAQIDFDTGDFTMSITDRTVSEWSEFERIQVDADFVLNGTFVDGVLEADSLGESGREPVVNTNIFGEPTNSYAYVDGVVYEDGLVGVAEISHVEAESGVPFPDRIVEYGGFSATAD